LEATKIRFVSRNLKDRLNLNQSYLNTAHLALNRLFKPTRTPTSFGITLLDCWFGDIEEICEYRQAVATAACRLTAFILLIAAFVYLVIQGHPKQANLLLPILGKIADLFPGRLSSGYKK